MTDHSPVLSAEMLLFEVACLCSRHGIAVTARNPAAARYHAEGMLQALGLAEPPAALPAGPAPTTPAATNPIPTIEASPLARIPRPPTFTPGAARVGGAHRSLRLAPERSGHA